MVTLLEKKKNLVYTVGEVKHGTDLLLQTAGQFLSMPATLPDKSKSLFKSSS
jgi:hypothetical protein